MGRKNHNSERAERCSPEDGVIAQLGSDDRKVHHAHGLAIVVTERDRKRDESQWLNPFLRETQQSSSYMENVRFLEAHLEEGRFK
ncbi:hypothetical protein AXF42_Ash018781 [Apostasia shenzhenica]|uniref:Uncharacterized protein n=1 Tax=Apostasia shenzhenica TaxID=1088818 RepID=A0A2I0AJY2_9ASPA|nr:hypothetical protein AXF42_Ash018781 [Apostasia shenzhenica]